MSNTYGTQNPIFYASSSNWVLQAQTITPRSATISDATNASGDIIERKYIGIGATEEVSETYALKQGTITSLPHLGYHTNPECIVTSVEISTSNSDWPKLAITFTRDTTPDHSLIIAHKTQYYFPSNVEGTTIQFVGKRLAQSPIIGGLENVQSANLSASITINELVDGVGAPCALGFSGGSWEASAEALGGTPTFTPTTEMGTNADFVNEGALSYTNTDWGTISTSVQGILSIQVYEPIAG